MSLKLTASVIMVCLAFAVIGQLSTVQADTGKKTLYVVVTTKQLTADSAPEFFKTVEQIKTGLTMPDVEGNKDIVTAKYDIKVIMLSVESDKNEFTYIENTYLPLMRTLAHFKNAPIVFAFSDGQQAEFKTYLGGKFDIENSNASMAGAWTYTVKGIAFAPIWPGQIYHESHHLAICGTWHDNNWKPLGYIRQDPQAAGLPWCQ